MKKKHATKTKGYEGNEMIVPAQDAKNYFLSKLTELTRQTGVRLASYEGVWMVHDLKTKKDGHYKVDKEVIEWTNKPKEDPNDV